VNWFQNQTENLTEPAFILHLGAGIRNEIGHIKRITSNPILLVEANPEMFAALAKQTARLENLELLPLAVSDYSGQTLLNVTAAPNYSNISSLDVNDYPTLNVVHQIQVQAISASELVDSLDLDTLKENWLILETPGEEAKILRDLSANKLLNRFSHIFVRSLMQNSFSDAKPTSSLASFLSGKGFTPEGSTDYQIPKWPRYHFKKDRTSEKIRQLSLENDELKKGTRKLEAQNDQLMDQLRNQDSHFQELKENTQKLRELNGQIMEDLRNSIEGKAEDAKDDLIGKIKRHVTQQHTNTVRQIESYLNIKSYLRDGELMPSLHGWPVSADFAQYVFELLNMNKYDLIIEFGSGSSTVLLAKALRNQTADTSDSHHKSDLTQSNFDWSKFNFSDLHKPIVSFDHHPKWLGITEKAITSSRLTDFVDLILAPLTDYSFDNLNHFKYYSCHDKLAEISRTMRSSKQRILALVDGPPGDTCKHARFPAAPILLEIFHEHSIDILMDDYFRKEEKEIVELWCEILDRKQREYDKQVLSFEKGACLLSIT
jgi:hypothetical protein